MTAGWWGWGRLLGLSLLGLSLGAAPLAAQTVINGSRILSGTLNACTDTNADANANTFVCTLTGIGAYRTGAFYLFLAGSTNTGAATFNLNSLGAKALKKVVSTGIVDVTAGDIQTGRIYHVVYDGTTMQVLSQVGNGTQTIASGTLALATSAIASGACATEQTATATGTVTTDTVMVSFNGDVTGITGYTPITTGTLRIDSYPKSGQIGVRVCNATSASITPGAVTLNFRVVR